MISYPDFAKLDLRIGKIVEAAPHPNADKLVLLKVDIGEKVIQLVAGIKEAYEPEILGGKLIVVLTNLEPRKIRGELSEGMLLAARSTDTLSLLTTERAIEPGSAVG